jgi:RNA polymerase sigma-70 factor (ECF subfamily)
MYEEKSTEEIASQVGLSENATRQLIFRARAAFKKALIGDVDTTGMSAAAILSVAARKAASEGKKVGAAALTLIALVVMSLAVFPGLNRATTDQIAEAPVNSGSSSETGQSEGVTETPSLSSDDSAIEAPTGLEASSDAEQGATAAPLASPSPSTVAKSQREKVSEILESPAAGVIFNSDSMSRVFAIDQNYTAVGDKGLTARFTFNPSSDSVFSKILVEIEIDGYFFEFEPVNRQLITGQNADGRDVYMLVGDATYVYDEFGRKWSKSDLGKSIVKIEIVMDANGTSVKSINLALYNR